MMEVYALADIALHCGQRGVFYFYRWGRYRRIIVENGTLTAEMVWHHGKSQKV